MKMMRTTDLVGVGSKKEINANAHRITILSFVGCYLPGFKGGGPIRSVSNLLNALKNEINFFLITSDRDLGDFEPYSKIVRDQWQAMGDGGLYYAAPGASWLIRLMRVIVNFEGDAIHLNGFFSFRFSILPILIWKFFRKKKPILIFPKGEFSAGALGFKTHKKMAYIKFAKILCLYKNVIWGATSVHEAEDIHRAIGQKVCVRIAPNIACPPSEFYASLREIDAPLRVIFVSRISPMKNLLGAMQILRRVQCPMVFDIYGPIEDVMYWGSCQEAVGQLPVHIQCNYCGPLYPAQIPDAMARYDLFYLPTLGENFGHVIAEALGCGLPVLISDKTPWRDLSTKGLGWSISLDQPDQFAAAIESCSRMSAADYDAWRRNIRAWALINIGNNEAVAQNRQIFMNLNSKYEH